MKNLFPNYVRVPLLFFAMAGLMEYLIDSGDQPAFIKYPMLLLFLLVVLLVLIVVEAIISAIDQMSYRLMTPEQREARESTQALPITQQDWYKKLMQRLTRSRPIEDEAQLLLEHDYDGIKELDNDLPPWWKYSFYATIVFSVVYMFYYSMDGNTQQDEFENAMAQAKIAVEEYKRTAPDMMDENSVTLLTDAEALAAGKSIYDTSCLACHRADGGGTIGPNLTDDHWILGGGIKNIFATVSNGGRDGKGMVAWKNELKPKEIQQVSSYIVSLGGTNPPDAKAPEGEIWTDEPTASTDGAPQ